MSDASFSDDKDLEYGRSSRGTSKRRKGAAGNPVPATRGATTTLRAEQSLLDPLHEILAQAYADEEAPDVDFEQTSQTLLPEYAQAREAYIERLPKDGLGNAVEFASVSDIAHAISVLKQRERSGTSDALLSRKLKLQQHRTTRNIPQPKLTSHTPSTLTALPTTPKPAPPPPQVLASLHAIRTTPYENSFLSRLLGTGDYPTRPAVHVDWEARAPWMEVMEDVRMHRALMRPEEEFPDTVTAPITYVTLAKEHLPQVHDLLRRTFWDGVNVSDSLQYGPERATIVAVYKRLVIGVALLSSPQETYITYLAVRSGWENARIATTMLYLLISRNPNKDFTLHVSANNPAMLLYNRFGFKAEEFVVGFYDAYLDPNARASKNAFRLRLRA